LTQSEIKNWNITNELLKNETIKNFRQKNTLNTIYVMIYSGARGNISQIKQICGMRGLMVNAKGEILTRPIRNNFKEGLNIKEYFTSCYGARKGIIDTSLKTATSGYLTRKLIYLVQDLIVKQSDCKTKNGKLVKIKINKKEEYNFLLNKLIGRILGENLKKKKQIGQGQDICNYVAKIILQNESSIIIKSSLNCKLNVGICQLCYGWNLASNKIVKIGETVGILAAQSIGEPGTQLTMRTFHTGGIYTSKITKTINSPHKGKLIYSKKNIKEIIYKENNTKCYFLKKTKNVFIKKNKLFIYKITLPKKSIIFYSNNKNVFKKQLIGEIIKWKIKNKKIKINKEEESKNTGESLFIISPNQEENYKKLWILNGYRINYNFILKNKRTIYLDLKKGINLKKYIYLLKLTYKANKKLKFKFKKVKIVINKLYELNKKTINKKLLLCSRKNNKQIFKVKNKKLAKIIKKYYGQIEQRKKNKVVIKKGLAYLLARNSKIKILNKKIISKNNKLFTYEFEEEKTEDIIEGLPKIQAILEAQEIKKKMNINKKLNIHFEKYSKVFNNKLATNKTISLLQLFLIKELQLVYSSQGIEISEKHIEIILKQLTSKVVIKKTGGTNVMEGEIINLNKIEKINKLNFNKAFYQPIYIGISKLSLLKDGFISAACFQETIRILTNSAIKGKIDWLKGLKENLIIGNLIPAGTSFNRNEGV
jgi:DNA-directed RNA polymerase subunit beta'